jgi:hypothetical protein
MAYNTTQATNTSGVATGEELGVSKGLKKKGARKKAVATPTGRSAAGPRMAPGETVFQDLPSPYHAPVAPYIWIDHPQQNERLRAPIYVIRLGVGGARNVEISLDGGSWQNCRLNSGYWWFDWSAIAPGKHTLLARMWTQDGRALRTPPRTCEYRP